MIRLIAVAAFALAVATSAQAMPVAPLHQTDGTITQVRYYGGYRHYGYSGYRHYGYRHYGYGGHYGYRHYGYGGYYGYRPYGYGVARRHAAGDGEIAERMTEQPEEAEAARPAAIEHRERDDRCDNFMRSRIRSVPAFCSRCKAASTATSSASSSVIVTYSARFVSLSHACSGPTPG